MEKMIGMIVILFSISFAVSAHAQDDEVAGLVSAANTVKESLEQVKDAGKVSQPCTANLEEAGQIVLTPHFNLNGVKGCNQFIKDDGSIGPWGNSVVSTIVKLPSSELENSFFSNDIPDMDFICPKFKDFSQQLKLKFWVWTFSSISWQESGCNPNVTAVGTNAKAVGLLQLEDTRTLRKSRGENCDVPSVKDPKNNLACGVDILHQQLLGSKGSYFGNSATGELFWKSSYWQHLRLKDKSQRQQQLLTQKVQSDDLGKKTNIKELVMRFPFCQ